MNIEQDIKDLKALRRIFSIEKIPINAELSLISKRYIIDLFELEKVLGIQDEKGSMENIILKKYGKRAVEIIQNNLI